MLKLNLHCDNRPRPQYSNYDSRINFTTIPNVKPSLDNYQLLDIENGSVDEILINVGCLSSLDRESALLALKRWHELLRDGGILRLYEYDIYVITNDFNYYRVSLEEFETAMQKFKSFHCAQELRELLDEYNLTLLIGTIDEQICYFEARKNDDANFVQSTTDSVLSNTP